MLERLTNEELRLTNVSRIISLPCREETIRGYSRVSLLVIAGRIVVSPRV